MGIERHHQTKVSLINLEVQVQVQKNCTDCKKSHTPMFLLGKNLLLVAMCYHAKSFSIVFKMPEHIAIYTNNIAQHNNV